MPPLFISFDRYLYTVSPFCGSPFTMSAITNGRRRTSPTETTPVSTPCLIVFKADPVEGTAP